jgi:hypothetical protein
MGTSDPPGPIPIHTDAALRRLNTIWCLNTLVSGLSWCLDALTSGHLGVRTSFQTLSVRTLADATL